MSDENKKNGSQELSTTSSTDVSAQKKPAARKARLVDNTPDKPNGPRRPS
jgi:hypothetical protein